MKWLFVSLVCLLPVLMPARLCAADSGFAYSDSFYYRFTQAGQKVRFAVTIPYVQRDLEAFLSQHVGNAHLTRSVLTNSVKGRPVDLLQIGEPGAGRKALLITARHHACETMASFVLDGFLKAAMSETPDGIAFRENYVLYCVPFVDKDGVEAGDQGKNRAPHDHNRDYIENNLFTETAAIKALGDSKNIEFLLDIHCPTLRMDIHQAFYFDGPKLEPLNNFANATALGAKIKAAMPPKAPGGPVNYMGTAPEACCSKYFSTLSGMIVSTALEIPFAPVGAVMDANAVRQYGEAILSGWVQTTFLP